MASRVPWDADQDRGENMFSRTRGVNRDSERRRRGSSRRSGDRPNFNIWGSYDVCTTCDTVVRENGTRCSGCDRRSHDHCRDEMTLGENYRIDMCYVCIAHVKHALRKARAIGAFQRRNEDDWFKDILDYVWADVPIDPTGFRVLNELKLFIVASLQNGMVYQRVTPTITPLQLRGSRTRELLTGEQREKTDEASSPPLESRRLELP